MLWALVLAGGEGRRLRSLTVTAGGTPVPKQFCSLTGGRTLLEDALTRAESLVPRKRICSVVAQQHRDWWQELLAGLPASNVIMQPRNRGTGIGILYPLLQIASRDPDAVLILLPADHYVRDELVLRQALRIAVQRVVQDPAMPVLLGMRPERVDPELGYIVPGVPDERGNKVVQRFAEKPSTAAAATLIEQGGLWNSFIVIATAQSLIDMFTLRFAPLVLEMQVIVSRMLAGPGVAGWPAVVDLYERLPNLDFSTDLLEDYDNRLRVIEVPPCGWSDLGTPHRVAEALRHIEVPLHDLAHEPVGRINLHRIMLDRMRAGASPVDRPGL